MIVPTSARLSQSLSLSSNVSYEILSQKASEGHSVPMQIGSGKFAKVYKAFQRSARRNIRPVAVKILHDHATLADERLFKQEIDLLKELTTQATVHVIRTLDVVQLPPLVMCGCGVLYSPQCPRGCGQFLQRLERAGHEYPLLHCPRCGYEVSAEDIQQRSGDLVRPPAKVCCQAGSSPRANRGTLVNFVDREAVVMELVEHGLPDFPALQQQALQSMGATTLARSGSPMQTGGHVQLVRQIDRRLRPDRQDLLAQRAVLLEKLYLMVQLAEAVAWLHGEKKIVHKDLAPDNVMVQTLDGSSGLSDWRGETGRSLTERLRSHASFPRLELKVIDFGLADKDELSRSWYEEQDAVASTIKLPYLSPEARRRKERVSETVEINTEQQSFRIPQSLWGTYLTVLPGDLLADIGDTRHDHDLEIIRVEPDGAGGARAIFRGTPATGLGSPKYELVRRLGEPHDVYAVGALFYYILTGKHEEVDRLSSLVNLLQEESHRELVPSLLRLDKYYVGRRNAIPEPFLRDEIMLLILRAMVRGRPQSFVRSRIDRGPASAQALLCETRRIYHLLEDDLVAAGVKGRSLRTLGLALPTALLLGFLLGFRMC